MGLFWNGIASGQLTWGVGGNGGSGTWDPGTTADWWNGTTNVTWSANSDAIFAGTGGTVTSVFPGPSANSLTFNSLGYTIQSGWINTSAANFNVVTNQSATISSTLSSNGGNTPTLVKSGIGTLTVSGTNFLPRVLVNQGEYLVGGNSTLFFSDVTLANSPGVLVTLGQTSNNVSIQSLSGGGVSGGVVQPNATARTVTLTLGKAATFNGVMQDNGSGKLALTVFAVPTTVISLAGQNTYSGATSVQQATLSLSQNGSALNSAVTVQQSGILQLDNSTGVNANRISDSLDLTLQNGAFKFIGNASTAVEEVTGNLKFAGAVSITNTQPGAAASLLTFSNATRQSHGTIDFVGNGRSKWTGMANDSFGLVGTYATAGNEWSTVGGDGRVDALATYQSNINTALITDHVKITGGGITTLAASTQVATLNMQNSSGSTGILDVGASNTLTFGDGGILTSGTAASQIQNGTISADATGELVVTNRNALTISSNIAETVANTGLTKSGAGVLTLTGANTYSGITAIDQGTLVVSSDANLGTGTTIEFNGGTLKAAQSFSSSKNFTRGTNFVGTIDTAGFDLTFSGTNAAGISKTGAGSLTLTNPAAGSISVSQGSVILPSPTSGDVTLQGGTLVASGTLSSLSLSSASTLDIGGNSAATLTTTSYSTTAFSGQALTVRFGVGLSVQDLWTITNPVNSFSLSNGAFLFDFQNLGGAMTGTNYTLMNVQTFGTPLTASMFGFSPTATAAGWAGNFSVDSNTVSVNLTSVPEPSAPALLALGGLFVLCWQRRKATAPSLE